MVIKSMQTPEKPHESKSVVEFVAEGGTIWTTNFDSYKKSITVTLVGNGKQTEVSINMVLPGGIMSLQDRERAAGLIDSFYESLQNSKL